jgi:hypothetical protein
MTDNEFWEFQRRLREARKAKPPVYPARFAHLKYTYWSFMKPYANFVPSTESPKHVPFLFYFWFNKEEDWADSVYVLMDGYPVRTVLSKSNVEPDNAWEGTFTDKSGITHMLTLSVLDVGHREANGRDIHGAEVTLTIDGRACYRTSNFYWHGNPGSYSHDSPECGDWSGITVCNEGEVPEDIHGYDRYVIWAFEVVREDIGE